MCTSTITDTVYLIPSTGTLTPPQAMYTTVVYLLSIVHLWNSLPQETKLSPPTYTLKIKLEANGRTNAIFQKLL